MANNLPGREPERFAAGDTLWFRRYLPQYLPGDGWFIQGAVTSGGGQQVAQFVSAADNNAHLVKVVGFLLEAAPGQYVLSEEVVNAGLGVRHQIYYEALTVTPDLADGAAPGPILTFAQQVIAALEAKVLYLESINLSETEQHRTRFVIEEKNQTLKRLQYWYEKRQNEVQLERGRNGGGAGNNVGVRFCVG